MNELLSVQNLSCTYSPGTPFEKEAVKDVSFTIKKGECIAVIGHTGSGKSTLIQTLNGLIRPTSGKVLWKGQDIWDKKADRRRVRFQVGLCFQYPEYQLFEETVYADIAFGPKNKGLSDEDTDRAVRKAAAFVGLDEEYLQASPFELSGGQKRRAAIAGVIAMEPEVLVLDEPTAGLDPNGRDSILAGIDKYRREKDATVLLVTHSMEDAAAHADKLLVMDRGHLAYFDTCQAVFSHAEHLRDIGLGLPAPAELFTLLRKQGYDLPVDVFDRDRAVRELLTLLSEGGVSRA